MTPRVLQVVDAIDPRGAPTSAHCPLLLFLFGPDGVLCSTARADTVAFCVILDLAWDAPGVLATMSCDSDSLFLGSARER